MNSSTLGTTLIALAAGLTGAVSLLLMQSLDESSGSSDGAVTAQQVSSLQRQLTDITSNQDILLRRLQQLELDLLRGRPSAGEATPMLATPDAVAALQNQVLQLNEAVAQLGDDGGPSMFTIDDVGSALTAIRDQEDADREAQRAAMREERLAERLAAVSTELGLDTYQKQQLGDAAALATESMDETFREARESGDWAELRTSMDTARAGFDSEAALFLSLDQQASFAELGGLRALGGFGGRGGFGSGGFGGGRGGDR